MKRKITIAAVQKAFNRAIVRRDGSCKVRDGSPCTGALQCSHFFPVGGNTALRFYPYNAFAQCAGHHFTHHNRNPAFYHEFLLSNYPLELKKMEKFRRKSIRWTQETLCAIYEHCKKDELAEVARIIEKLLKERRV